MAEGLNRVLLFGNLGADPELRMTSGGNAVLKLRLATTESYVDRNRQRQERTEWHSIVVWGKRAEALSKFLSKGNRLFVEGSLRTSSYEDRNGSKRHKTEVVASNIVLAGSGSRRQSSEDTDEEPRSSGGSSGSSGGGGYSYDDYGMGDDDIPF